MLKINDIHTYYDDSHILQGITLEVERGTVISILGRNGVGKTTLVHSIVGFTPPSQGQVLFKDTDITRLPSHKIIRMGVGLIPQNRRIFPSLTVKENLAVSARNSGTNQWHEDRIFELFPRLSERLGHNGDQLSGGEQQMLAIGRALIGNPDFLLMDEPTEGLAPRIVEEIADAIILLKKEGIPILIVEQNIASALKVSEYIHIMNKGTIVYSSTPEELWENEEIKSKYLGIGSMS